MILYDILKNPKKNIRSFIIIIIFIIIFLSALIIIINFLSTNGQQKNFENISSLKQNKKLSAKNMVMVQTAEIKEKDVPIYINAIGTITALDSVVVKTQINGELTKVNFREGQFVKKGEILAEIDDRTYKAQFIQYQGQLNRDLALFNNAIKDLKRYKNLFPIGGISKQTLDTQKSLVKQYEGIVEFDKGQLEAVKVNLNNCKISAPISGKAGLRLVNPGNYVQISDQSGLVIINKMQPISVLFSLSQEYLTKLTENFTEKNTLKVLAYDKENKELLAEGKLNTIDNQIDTTTGTIKLRAEFENTNLILYPNQFVNIKLLLKTEKNALIIPISAVQHGKDGDYVYLKEKNKAKFKKIVSGDMDQDYILIKEGLKLGDIVITDGLDKLTDGADLFQ
ncbi:efflux RND transporter periplasmic adaptor subunit [Pigmentibacter ruber]|uniref:efflux RND transporter periplasmic adaptor subunit n=1 Tax=Pigmentibacter ruber TaxID=2683196 RepID=UPI00131C3D4F|nr:efflux RND transporter periplasmic adaptor subunit [Pigmentibacter ruber]